MAHLPAVNNDENAIQQTDIQSKPIGEILVAGGKLTQEQVASIAAYQQQNGKQFGEAALALNLISRDDLTFALSKQYDYTYLSPLESRIQREVVVAYKPFSQFGEQIRALRTQLALKWFGESPERRALSIVSPLRGEGKSFVCANLGISFAQQGLRTLLIDANLREPSLQRMFGLENGPGLSGILTERVSVATAIERVAEVPSLNVLPAGPIPPNPQELLGRPLFSGVLMYSVSNYDVVLIDTPSVAQAADSEVIAARVGAALVVVRNNRTSVDLTNQLTESLRNYGVNVLGAMLNDAT